MSPVKITSDGSTNGTRVEVDGVIIPCTHITWQADVDNDYGTATLIVPLVALDVEVVAEKVNALVDFSDYDRKPETHCIEVERAEPCGICSGCRYDADLAAK